MHLTCEESCRYSFFRWALQQNKREPIKVAQRVSLQTEGPGFHTEMSNTLNYRTITIWSQKIANLNLSWKKKNEIVETILEPTELLKMSLTNCETREIKIRWPKGEWQCPQLSPSHWVTQSGVSTLQVQEAGGPELMHVSCFAPHPGQQPLEGTEWENSPAVKLDVLEFDSPGRGNEHRRNLLVGVSRFNIRTVTVA